jgi:hypothetical protein
MDNSPWCFLMLNAMDYRAWTIDSTKVYIS